MKLLVKTALFMLVAMVAVACSEPSEKKEKTDQGTEQHEEHEHHDHENHEHHDHESHEHHDHESHDHGLIEGLSLNEGQTWEANAETTTGVNNMIAISGKFSEPEDEAAYLKLSEELKTEYNLIFENCTMEGEAHNQLHSFLVPLSDIFDGIASEDLARCKTNFEKLELHLAEYKVFFK